MKFYEHQTIQQFVGARELRKRQLWLDIKRAAVCVLIPVGVVIAGMLLGWAVDAYHSLDLRILHFTVSDPVRDTWAPETQKAALCIPRGPDDCDAPLNFDYNPVPEAVRGPSIGEPPQGYPGPMGPTEEHK